MNLEGRITIQLDRHEGKIAATIRSNRPVHASRIFHGKSIDETLYQLPLLYSICGTAQASAAVNAIENVLDITPSAATLLIRDQLLRLETIREHLWRSLIGWNEWLQRPSPAHSLAEMMTLKERFQQRITANTSPFRSAAMLDDPDPATVQSTRTALNGLLQRELFGTAPDAWLELETIPQFEQWLKRHQTIATAYFNRLKEMNWSDAGRCDALPLPIPDLATVDQRMSDDMAYIEQPLWEGRPCETSPLTRTETPLLLQLSEQLGNGLLTRGVARLTETAQLVATLDRPMQHEAPYQSDRCGIGTVQAARGLLIHQVEIEQSTIHRYRILAPTEWNFHPNGVVAQSLSQLAANDEQLERQAHLIIHAIDPCVGYDLINNIAY